MRVLPEFSGVQANCDAPCAEQDEAVVGLQASIRSSDSLKGILECARRRQNAKAMDAKNLELIERICARYERHQKEVRDHCLDYFNQVPSARMVPGLASRTNFLVKEGKVLYSALRGAILATM
jgi:hypothetical protein